jgi:NUMOD3 motif
MNHQKIYESIIQKAKSENRIKYKLIYYEKHHILPKCLGGTDDKGNLVLLTAKEHYLCHKLLTYIYKNNYKINLAFSYMTKNKKGYTNSARNFAYAKELCKKWTAEQKKNNTWAGKHHNLESIKKMKKPKSEETKKKFSKAKKGKSYKEIYGSNSLYMKEQRKKQTSGSGNPNARQYIIHNSLLNKYWYCTGNLSQFCATFHVSGRTLQLSQKTDSYVNNWKCIYTNEIPSYCIVF